jgi:hypothetical protein
MEEDDYVVDISNLVALHQFQQLSSLELSMDLKFQQLSSLELSMDLNFTDEFHEVIELNWRK